MKDLFVWVKSQKRSPTPQLWPADMVQFNRTKFMVLQEDEIPEAEAALGLDILARYYPYQGEIK